MDDIIHNVDQVFKNETLIGNHDFIENEYSSMVDYVGTLYDNFDKNHYKLIFATLIEIAKRWKQKDFIEDNEENCGYWNYAFKILFNSDINQQLCQKYRNVISWLGENANIPVVTSGQKYYATVMMHSFAPKNSICSFFDLCYNVFKKDLDFGFTSDDEEFCVEVAAQLEIVLGHHGYRENIMVHIGSSAYAIKIGLRSLAVNEDLSTYFVKFISDTFNQINRLFNREIISKDTRLKRYIYEWWEEKTESEKLFDGVIQKKRISTVSKQNIVAKYIKDDKEVFLCIPPIRIDDDTNKMRLFIFVDDQEVYSEEMRTKRGELVITTKPIEFELNKLLKWHASINVKIKIQENETIIFDSEMNKTTSLKREFILFDGEKEIFSQINKPTNYFVYSKNIDGLKNTPKELTTYSTHLYNIYPRAGECLTGDTKEVVFINKEKEEILGNNICLIGKLKDVEWLFDDISWIVYTNFIKLMVPDNFNIKALELRIDMKSYKLHELKYEQVRNNCYQFGLKALGIISENEPIEISLYSYEKETTILFERFIILTNLDIQFNKLLYYGNSERKVIVSANNESKELSWTNQDNEIRCPINDGVLQIKIPYFRWRINNNEWHNEPISRKLWYKDYLANGDLLEIDNPREYDEIKMIGKTNEDLFEVIKNHIGKFEIGRAIFTNEDKNNIFVYCSIDNENLELFNVLTKEQFIDNPLIYRNGKVLWDVENTFIGVKDNDFFLILKGDNSLRTEIGNTNIEFSNIDEDNYKVKVKIKDKNIFSKTDNYKLIFEGDLIVGQYEKLKFKKKKIILTKAKCFHCYNRDKEWLRFKPEYYVDHLEFVQEEDGDYYRGRLCVIDKFGETKVLNTMINKEDEYDPINPIRIEFRDNKSLWLVAGWQGGSDFLGDLFCDFQRRGICNIEKEEYPYSDIRLYKFREDNV